jgi:hypothetical protein
MNIVWLDLASSFHFQDTIEFIMANSINFLPEDMNLLNVPQCRPIEIYWALIKNMLERTNKPAKNITLFKQNWSRPSGKVKKAHCTEAA